MKIKVPVELGVEDIENLAMELEVTDNSFMTEFIEALLQKAAIMCKETENAAKELAEVNPYGVIELCKVENL